MRKVDNEEKNILFNGVICCSRGVITCSGGLYGGSGALYTVQWGS